MRSPLSAVELLDLQFLEIRAKLLDLAASLDRLQRADGPLESDPRMVKVRQAVDLLLQFRDTRPLAERMQLLFSLAYDPEWRSRLAEDPRFEKSGDDA
jgi:hypothetical protein